jgi:hypothetical protein
MIRARRHHGNGRRNAGIHLRGRAHGRSAAPVEEHARLIAKLGEIVSKFGGREVKVPPIDEGEERRLGEMLGAAAEKIRQQL